MNAEMEPPSTLNSELITKSLNFHGQLLQKSWEVERGEGDLMKHNVGNLDYEIYSQRQKHLSFQDRGKRLKLHQFISKRADVLFDDSLIEQVESSSYASESGHFALLPSFESFLSLDKSSRSQHFLQCLKPADVIICSITSKANSGLILKVLCADSEVVRCVGDLAIKAFCPTSNLISAVDKKNVPRTFMLNDIVACEVLEVLPDSEKIICGMKGVHTAEHKARLGLFHSDDFPEVYKLSLETKSEPYEELLEKSVGFHNPSNVTCLSSIMKLGNVHHTNMMAFKSRFPEAEYANELRTVQAAKWAFRSVADGIEHFKSGRPTEAFQCLNKALTIDPANIEGLVARGALYANSGSFKKAVEDFECALKQNHSHANARKYLGETLVAYGRSFEDTNKLDEALKCYEKCLEVVPYHEEAHNSIEFIKAKLANGSMSLTDGLVSVGSLSGKTGGVKDTLKLLLGNEQPPPPSKDETAPTSAKKKKKEKKAKKHKRGHSSSSSSSSSSGSSSSSSSSSSSDTSSVTSNDSHRKKKHKSRKSETKEKSLSPLSKRMAIMDSTSTAETDGQRGSHYNPPAMPYSFSSDPAISSTGYPAAVKPDKESEYEQRVCKFLEQTKGDSDYEEKVRKFLDETAKWKKDRKAFEEKAKKKRKKEKKARSKNKKKKRDERKKKKMLKELEEKKLRDVLRKQRRRSANMEDDDDFLYGEKPDLRLSLPDLEDLQSKLSYYVKVEKGNSSSKKKEKSSSVEKLVAAVQAKKAASPKVLYLEEEKEEVVRSRKLEKKKMDMFEPSPSPPRAQDAKNVPLPSAPPPPSSKFKMQIGSNQPRMKKRGEKSEEKETWDDIGEKRFIYVNEGMGSIKEPEPKKIPDKKKEIEEQMAKTPMIMDKLGGFRINPLNADKKIENDRPTAQKRKLRSRVSESDSSDSDIAAKKKERQARSPQSSRSRSRSRSHKKYSSESPPPKKYSSSSSRSPSYRKDRSRSKSGSYRSRSGRRYRSSESGSYRTRSRSRSRSMDYHRRSRSRSDDRHHYRKYPGRYPRNRGTYYRPRFQTGFKTRPGGFFPRGRGGPWRPGGRPFIPRMRGRGRPRFFHYNNKPRDDRYRRYERDMSRSDDDDGSPMRKVDAAKERIDRMLSEDKRHTGPLSEGEERDDDYMERERPRRSASPDMDRSKKEGSKERSKASGKPNPW